MASIKFNRKMALSGFLACIALIASPAGAQTRTGPRKPATIDWPTFGGSAQRTGYNGSETILSPATVPNLQLHWRVGISDLLRYQPSLLRNVATPGGTYDLLLITLRTGEVETLDAATGNTVWSVTFPAAAISCKGQTASLGIGEPATIDTATQTAYVVDGGGMLHALSMSTGAEMPGFPVEIIDEANLAADTWVHYASPTLVGKHLYLATAAGCESTAVPYHGQVIDFDLKSAQVAHRYYPVGNGATLGGGLWGTGGVAADKDASFLWGGTANDLPPPQNTGNAEKIIQLDLRLKLKAANGPVLSPSGDLDFGSTPLLYDPPNCPPMLAALNKSGILVTYDRTNLTAGPVQQIQIAAGGGGGKLIGMAAFDPVTNAVYVSNPADAPDGTYLHGLLAFQVNQSCQLALLWQQTVGSNNNDSAAVPPTVANGVVWLAEGKANAVAAFDAATGTPLWTTGPDQDFESYASPIVVNGQMFVGRGHYVYAFGL